MYSYIFKLNWNYSTPPFNQTTTIHQTITYLMDNPMYSCIFLLNFIIINKLLFFFTYFIYIISTFSIRINNIRTTLWSSSYSFPLILIFFLFRMQYYYIDDYYYSNIILTHTNIIHYIKKLRKFQVSQLKRICQMKLINWLKKNDIDFDLDQYLYY